MSNTKVVPVTAAMLTEEEALRICRTQTPMSLGLFYEWVYRDRGWKVPAHIWPAIYALCDTRIENLMYIIGPGSTKSTLLSIIYPAWRLGHDPSQTFIVLSGAEDLAKGFMGATMEIIEWSDGWRKIFPNVRPNKARGWSSAAGIYVTGRKLGTSDANFWSAGLMSKTLVGKHARNLILDDLHSDGNSSTEAQCQNVISTYYNTILGRADANGCRSILAGRRWHEKDIYGHLQAAEAGRWVTMTLPAEREGSRKLWIDITVPDEIECVFTDSICHCGDGTQVRITH